MSKSNRGISLAKTWKKKQIEQLIKTKDEMVNYKIDDKLIEDYIIKEKERIYKEYEKRIEKHKSSETNNKKKKDIEILIKNKNILEKMGYTPKQIEEYLEKGMNDINLKYTTVDFID